MDIKKDVIKSINSILNLEGITIEVNKDGFYMMEIDVSKPKEYLNIGVSGKYINRDLFLSKLIKMINNDEIEIRVTNKATKEDIDYLEKLLTY